MYVLHDFTTLFFTRTLGEGTYTDLSDGEQNDKRKQQTLPAWAFGGRRFGRFIVRGSYASTGTGQSPISSGRSQKKEKHRQYYSTKTLSAGVQRPRRRVYGNLSERRRPRAVWRRDSQYDRRRVRLGSLLLSLQRSQVSAFGQRGRQSGFDVRRAFPVC